MARHEFPRAVKVAVIKRATRLGVVYCEKCGLPAKKFQIDHVIADSHGGKPVIENAELICQICYGVKNALDTTVAAKLKRIEAAHVGASAAPTKPIQSKGFSKGEKANKRAIRAAIIAESGLLRRAMFEGPIQ